MPRRKRKPIRTTADVIDEMYDLREQYRALDKESEELKRQWAEREEELLAMFDADGIDQSRTDLATASLDETVTASIEDPKRFWRWVKTYDKQYLVQNRVSLPAYREEMESRKEEIPGLVSFTKRTIGLRNRT